jgi:CelD/BcsL family acetyltransferase involved in cellulose biosynthesis
VKAWPSVRPIWASLAENSPYTSVFLTTDWIDTWLTVFGRLLEIEILTFESNNTVVASCLLVLRHVSRGPFRIRCIFLNTAGENPADSPYVEFNTLLCLEGFELKAAHALFKHISQNSWDTIAFQGCSMDASFSALLSTFNQFTHETKLVQSPFVNLEALTSNHTSYDTTLSSNTRSQIRRSIKLYEQRLGKITLHFASDIESAHALLDDLIVLHQASWKAKHKPGAFSAPRFILFHREFIDRMFPKGQIDLVRISAGPHTIAIMYNFIFRNKVYYYQSGFNYDEDTRLKPGLTAHYFSIARYLSQGLLIYDLLAGESRYKNSLTRNSTDLYWISIHNSNAKMKLIESLIAYKRAALIFLKRTFPSLINN